MAVLSSSYGIILDREINVTGHGKSVVDGLNATENLSLRGEMEFIGILGSNNTSKVGILPSASKDVSIKFAYQCLHIINNT